MFIRFVNYNKQVGLINMDHVNSISIQPAMVEETYIKFVPILWAMMIVVLHLKLF